MQEIFQIYQILKLASIYILKSILFSNLFKDYHFDSKLKKL